MPANTREMLIGFGKCKQDDIVTANTLTGIWKLGKLNTTFGIPKLNTEDDAAELGKGHEFAENVYQTSWDVAGQFEKYLSAEFAAWAFAFGLGHVVKSGTTPNWVYTCTPLDPVTEGLELPYFSVLEQVRPTVPVLDKIAIGCAVEGMTLSILSGPGRASAKLTVDYVGSGKFTSPSSITLPAKTAEKLLSNASLALTLNTVDYVAAKKIVSLEWTWKNNIRLDDGFYPGSGFQGATSDTGAVRGRLEIADRAMTCKVVARFDENSTELDQVEDQTEGTCVFSLTYDTNNSLSVTLQRTRIAMAEPGDNNGLLVITSDVRGLYHTSNGLITAVAKCNIDGIAQAEA